MQLIAPKNTLAYQLKGRAAYAMRVNGTEKLSDFVPTVIKYGDGPTLSPLSSALLFYLMNHGVANLVRTKNEFEPLTDDELYFVRMYNVVVNEIGVHLLYYIARICTGELRHLGHGRVEDAIKVCKASGKVSDKGVDLLTKIGTSGSSRTGAFNSVVLNWVKLNDSIPLAEFAEMLCCGFDGEVWGHGGCSYGGPKWQVVADCFRRFVVGETTPEMMLDTGWTLAHNGGPIFNKGFLFTNVDQGTLTTVLDTQRSGQIPNLLLNAESLSLAGLSSTFDKTLQEAIDKYKVCFGTPNPVDWFAVESLGGLGSYNHQKKMQMEKYGVPAGVTPPEAPPSIATHYYMWPGHPNPLKKIKMKRT